MSQVNFQTAKLTQGRHRTPAAGVCVMELASMVAGEPFSDHPSCVSPIIGGFLRGYNDAVGARLRPDLKRFATDAIGSVAGRDVERRRRELVRRSTRGVVRGLLARYWLSRGDGEGGAFFAGLMAGRDVEAHSDLALHDRTLAMVDELIVVGAPQALMGATLRVHDEPRTAEPVGA